MVSALLVYWLWAYWGLSGIPPKPLGGDIAAPGGWRRFTVLILPVLCLGPTLILFLVQFLSPRSPQVWRLCLRTDMWATIVSALLWSLIPLAWSQLSAPLIYIGAAFLIGLTLKSASLLRWLFQGLNQGPRRALTTVLVLWTIFGGMAVWAERSLTTSGDAVTYLLFTHSLAKHGQLDSKIAVEKGEYRQFYWGGWSKTFAQDTALQQARLFPFVLVVPYALGGRLGVLLFYALLLAGAAAFTAGWLVRMAQAKPQPALGAALLVIGSCPVVFLAHLEFPDTVGLFLLSFGLWLLSRIRSFHWINLAPPLALAIAVYFIKQRLIVGFVGLGAASLFEMLRLRFGARCLRWAAPAVLSAMTAAFMLLASDYYWAAWRSSGPVFTTLSRTLSGLFWDQSYGLFMAAPIFLVCLAGLPVTVSQRPRAAFSAGLIFLISLFLLVYGNWYAWHGGFGPPFRYLSFTLPVWAVFLLPWLERPQAPLKRMLWLSAAWVGIIYLAVGFVLPVLRLNRPFGASRFWQFLESILGFPVYHLLPSAFMHTAGMAYWGWAGMAAAGLAAWWLWRKNAQATEVNTRHWSRHTIASLMLVLVGFGCLLFAARQLPPHIFEAELMQSSNSSNWAPSNPLHVRGKVFLNKSTVRQRLYVTNPGVYNLTAAYIAQSSGQLRIVLDGEDRGVFSLSGTKHLERAESMAMLESRFTGRYRTASSRIEFNPGWHLLELIYQGPDGRDNWLLLDYVALEPAKD